MSKRYKFIALSIVILAYAFMQIATSKSSCDADCQTLNSIYTDLRSTYDAVYSVNRCPSYQTRDSICVYVDPSVTTDWNLVVERACSLATANGLLQQYIMVLSGSATSIDTLARMRCP